MEHGEKPIYSQLSYQLNGGLFKVHNELGRYRNEKQYADALEHELTLQKIPFEREKIMPVSFAGEMSGRNKVDFLIQDKVILELKSKRILTKEDYYQTKRYLTSTNKKLGILVNFREQYLKPRRILNSLARE